MLESMCLSARAASTVLGATDTDTRNNALSAMADALVARADEIIKANESDIARARENGMTASMLDRLTLTKERITAILIME